MNYDEELHNVPVVQLLSFRRVWLQFSAFNGCIVQFYAGFGGDYFCSCFYVGEVEDLSPGLIAIGQTVDFLPRSVPYLSFAADNTGRGTDALSPSAAEAVSIFLSITCKTLQFSRITCFIS